LKHCEAIVADENALQVLEATCFYKKLPHDQAKQTILAEGIIINNDPALLAKHFITAIAQHRFWDREKARKVPA